jgi:hypothetical protein
MPQRETSISSLVNFQLMPVVTAMKDPLLDLIKAYKAGIDEFNLNAPEDDAGANAYAGMTYMPPLKALMAWTAPAATSAGAVAALKLAQQANRDREVMIVAPMLQAAILYFEKVPFE